MKSAIEVENLRISSIINNWSTFFKDKMIKLDKIDRKILLELDKNSRQHISTLSRKLRLGRDLVTYRIKRLQDRGIISRFTALVDPYRLGLSINKVYLKLENRTSRRSELVKYLKKHKSVYWVAECDGAWDLIFTLLADTAQKFYLIRGEILSKFDDIVIESALATLVDIDMCYKHYFQGKGQGHFFIGGEQVDVELDDIDRAVLKILADNSRTDIKDLAETINSTPTVVTHRIKKLEDLKVIVGYRIDVGLEELGMTFFKAQLFPRVHNEQVEEELRQYVRQSPHITYFIRQIGPCTLELELDANDYYHFNEILGALRKKFCGILRNIETILVRNDRYKWVEL